MSEPPRLTLEDWAARNAAHFDRVAARVAKDLIAAPPLGPAWFRPSVGQRLRQWLRGLVRRRPATEPLEEFTDF